MIELYPDQASLVDKVRAAMHSGYRSPLLVAPCGFGKTVLFSFFGWQANQKRKRVLILAHRDELLDQISKTLMKFRVRHSFISGDRWYLKEHLTHVASVQTVVKRLDKIQPPDFIIIDEAHHAIPTSSWGKVMARFPAAWKLGVTASPQRLSGEPLSDLFDTMLLGPSTRELIESGRLAPYRIFAPSRPDLSKVHTRMGEYSRGELACALDKPSITGSALAHYQKLAPGKRAVAFCVSVEHARNVAKEFLAAGISSESLDGTMHRELRRQTVERFRTGYTQVLTSCDIISEGFDLPAIEVAIMLRPTQSLALWIQQSGRALRTFPGKTEALILDHAGNTERHGLPDDERAWSLNSPIAAQRTKRGTAVTVRICERCFAAQPPRPECWYCGYVFPIQPREVEEIEGELVELSKEALRQKQESKRIERAGARTYEELVRIEKREGYKPGWAAHVFAARQRKKLQGGMR